MYFNQGICGSHGSVPSTSFFKKELAESHVVTWQPQTAALKPRLCMCEIFTDKSWQVYQTPGHFHPNKRWVGSSNGHSLPWSPPLPWLRNSHKWTAVWRYLYWILFSFPAHCHTLWPLPITSVSFVLLIPSHNTQTVRIFIPN